MTRTVLEMRLALTRVYQFERTESVYEIVSHLKKKLSSPFTETLTIIWNTKFGLIQNISALSQYTRTFYHAHHILHTKLNPLRYYKCLLNGLYSKINQYSALD